tara:strand:+ start:1632 stop:3869 length:2238 start_codon:yes stop_codon:yes gene_type:complete
MAKQFKKWLLYSLLLFFSPFVLLILGVSFNWFGTYQGPGEVVESGKIHSFILEEQQASDGLLPKQILFGDLHVHTTYSLDALTLNLPIAQGEGAHPVADACNFARFCSNLDFFAVTDHAEWLTRREWKDSLRSIQQCEKVSGNLDEPSVIPFLGWEWTQNSLNKDIHYGHKNIIIRGIKDDEVPQKPISSNSGNFDGAASVSTLTTSIAVALDFPNRKNYLDWRYKSLVAKYYENCEEDQEINSHDCYVKADTSSELFQKLNNLDSDLLVIPHGSAWGVTSPPLASWDVQLSKNAHDSSMNKLIEVYSGHGNSEEYRPWAPIIVQNNGKISCNLPSQGYLPDCFQAGEIIKERCRVAAGSDEECSRRAEDARQIFSNSNPFGLLTVPGYDPMEWKNSGQCQDCFLPAFDYRPKMSVQYALALTDFSSGEDIRFKYGFIGSSDNHQARPGTGYKENLRKLNSESRADMDNQIGRNLLNPRLSDPKLPLSQELDIERDQAFMNSLPLQSERGSSFLYTGGLAAAHVKARDREEIWNSLNRREVYATSGERILLWFNLVNHPDGLVVPMGAETEMIATPKFLVKAIGAQKQLPGCNSLNEEKLSSEVLGRLCKGECFNPSDERKNISRIEVIRIRPQVYEGEPINALIEDPWKTFKCKPSQEGCQVEFIDEQFEGSNREVVYYVRAVQEPSDAVNGSGLDCDLDQNGRCVKINLCGDLKGKGTGDCLSQTEERAWSSPIFIKFQSSPF